MRMLHSMLWWKWLSHFEREEVSVAHFCGEVVHDGGDDDAHTFYDVGGKFLEGFLPVLVQNVVQFWTWCTKKNIRRKLFISGGFLRVRVLKFR